VTTSGATIWFTGLSGAGKSTLSSMLAEKLDSRDIRHVDLDGDELRRGLNSDLGFSREDRTENVRRAGEVALLFARHGLISLVSLIAPYTDERRHVRERHVESGVPFILVHVATSLQVCESRDPKGLYARARRGEIEHFTGITDPYEAPTAAELVVNTAGQSPEESAERVLSLMVADGLIDADVLTAAAIRADGGPDVGE